MDNALVTREWVYLNLVWVFYLNILISTNTVNQVVANVSGIPIEFDVEDLNTILGLGMVDCISIYLGTKLIFLSIVINIVKNICRWSDPWTKFCNYTLKS